MAKTLTFGLGREVPDEAKAAWGARWIWPDDQLWDRQATTGDRGEIQTLIEWLNGGANMRARAAARNMAGLQLATGQKAPKPARRGQPTTYPRMVPPKGPRWHSNDEDVRELYRDEIGVIVGCPNGSHGYLYVAAWLHTGEAAIKAAR